MNKSTLARSLLLCIVLLLSALQQSAQTFYGSIVGVVSDATGGVISGAAVNLTNKGTGERRTVATQSDGSYRFVNLLPGTYRIEVEHSGFKRLIRDNIPVNVESAVRLDVTLEVGDTQQTIEVSAETPLLQTENASVSQVIVSRAVQELPLTGRNVLNLAILVPGVIAGGGAEGNLVGKNIFVGGNYQIGGGIYNQQAMYLDGIPMMASYTNLLALIPTQDAVSEFRVQTNSNSAEYGRFSGGVVNLTTKSGSNEFHGSAYEYLRNRMLNANTFFANATGTGKSAYVQNQFGAWLAGPVRKDRVFFFAGYEGYRQRQGRLFRYTVPTDEWAAGNFSDYRSANGQLIPIYDPTTQCGKYGNPACPASGPQRQPFPGNIIPPNRISPVSKKFLAYPYYGKPTGPGDPYTHRFNFDRSVTTGGDNDQINARSDVNLTEKHRMLVRYTRWHLAGLRVDVFGNGIAQADPVSPEDFTTQQAVLADTYTVDSTTVLDIRAGVLRFNYSRVTGPTGVDPSKTFGLPNYMAGIPTLNGYDPAKVPNFPRIAVSDMPGYYPGAYLVAKDTVYSATPTVTKITGRHSIKGGADIRQMYLGFIQLNTLGGNFTFNNIFTSQNALSPGATGAGIASFLLGYASGGSVPSTPLTAGAIPYRGYFVTDTWQVTSKLTLNLGLRWEFPGSWTERFDRLALFKPEMENPVLKAAGISLRGAFVLVNSPDYSRRSVEPARWRLFAPRVGVAYRLDNRSVLRAGGGIYYLPSNVWISGQPTSNPVNMYNNTMVATIDSGVTVVNTFDNPFPEGLRRFPGRESWFQSLFLGSGPYSPRLGYKHPYTQQYNISLQRQFPGEIAVDTAYVATIGRHLPFGFQQYNYLPTSVITTQRSSLLDQVANPFYGIVGTGVLAQPTVQRGQLLMPFPQYTSTGDIGYNGNSTYHALQIRAEKRFTDGGVLLASYSFSRFMSDVETLTMWLDSASGVQNWDNLRDEWALSNGDARQRLTISYVTDFPIGRGKPLLSGVSGALDKLISGWGASGMTTFQEGFPLGLTASPNLTGFNTGLRPNVVAGCDPRIKGSAQSRLNKWFDPACYSVPAAFTFGNARRNEPVLRNHGINNFDVSVVKRTEFAERYRLEFRAEIFNLFNRVRFGNPNQTVTTDAVPTTGRVTSQANNPRLVQLSLRVNF